MDDSVEIKPINYDQHFGFLVSDVARLLRERFNDTANALGLTLAQARVIVQLSRNEGTSQVALAAILEIAPITLLRQVDRLEEMQFINRQANPSDRRAQQLYLTKEGHVLLDRIWQLSDSLRNTALTGVDAKTEAHLISALQQIKSNLFTVGMAENNGLNPLNNTTPSSSSSSSKNEG